MNADPSGNGDADLRGRLMRLESFVSGTNDKEIDLRELFAIIWRGRWIVAAATVVFAVLSVALALYLPNQYKATATLVPASTASTSGLARLAGQFGGLASLAGINLGEGSNDKTVVAIELVKSWDFLEQFVRDNHIEVEVFAAKGWDRSSGQLVIDDDLYDVATKRWVRDFDPERGETAEPSGWELYEELRDKISIYQDKKTNLVSLSVEYYSPLVAKQWVDRLIIAINQRLQEHDRLDARKSIDYLQKQVGQTSISDMQVVFYRLIEEQTKNLMLTEVSDEYVLKTLSPAKVPEEKSGPKRAIICIAGTLLGAMLSALGLILHRRERGHLHGT